MPIMYPHSFNSHFYVLLFFLERSYANESRFFTESWDEDAYYPS